MKLGTKINLVLIIVTAVVLTVAFSVIVKIEADTTKKQVLNDAGTSADIFHDEIERMFKQIRDQQVRLQNVVDELSKVDGVVYVKVLEVDGVNAATSRHELIGVMDNDRSVALLQDVIKKGSIPDVLKDKGTFYEIERRIPIHLVYGDDSSEIIYVIEVEIGTLSKRTVDIEQAKKLLYVISSSIEPTARSIVQTRQEDISSIQKITDSIVQLGKVDKSDELGFYHDFIVADSNMNIVANTGHEKDEYEHDLPEYNKYREDVLSGKLTESYHTRTHEGQAIIVRIKPIMLEVDGKNKIVGINEVHILASAYTNKITVLKFRMLGIGIVFTAVLVIVLAIILRIEVVVPITKYSEVAKKIADGDLSQTVEHTSNDEIGQFGSVFNSMVRNLRELDKLKSDFISVAAHQLRTPLSGVKWVLKLLLDGDLGTINEDQKGMLKRGYETNEKMIQLVNDLLNVSRIENGKFGYKFEKNDFMKLIRVLMENTVLPSKARNIDVRLENRAGMIPDFMFDPEKLLIALQNIVDNAMKYTLPGGRVTIIVERQGDYIEVKVSDTGVGIPKADIAKLFSKFFRAANVIHLQTDGSGLGLFIVKSIIMRHGGQVWVDSVEGKGTTFTIVVPVVDGLIPKDEGTPQVVAPIAQVGEAPIEPTLS
ncbi:MAG: hypothetical protein COV32_03325 [Candidatus Yonathbacteria bacterium CG10_big_fil_rev_8_21_14_0_10_43_136]|uniref:histidine kinase n=1 Tax=Candidatus Yonathbacteria bacterium CG_4_10_14_0_8_um_filter_43_17 TaxID=1975099 RepID=A0A2M7Q448_9BACT|nr:MAG: hypothetical protein COW60_00405 [Candidatus Yonathbacteria bacterium CG17_big_fil_post_rev_8_21_14_2_50_43_9]PIR40387.1 MAG: hypothetical protein COV32_03325 [Candidatus Yonathbacteria bacterium CG10_big_fil_rev_8_21_14_0_10_43_136]PIX57502.1 MAG: hypothetical protein COZ48_00290 [Candidatus Yonathbacteria bacterium CG_4_10_14_3_um_filter_43_12]PIY58197.1 MAG: hypothetical protein COY98_03350 [Candidatus Yonathbacteria bacterium CG_4_10_14_0_8_um_filter_43_17]PJC21995.1 MAG: hypothetic